MGTPNELTNQNGEVIWLADYEAYGNTAKIIWREERLESLQVSADELQPIRFQGQSFDTETGLHYNRFRYFDPDLGMFNTRDPIGLMGGNNVFQYAPNPVGWVDPFGLAKKDYQVSANTALPDVEARGVHVNVTDSKTSMHVEIAGVKVDDGYKLEFRPADPTAKKASETSKWKKVVKSIEDFIKKPSNSSKLANVTDAASENFSNNGRDFKTTSETIKSCT